MSLTEIMSGAGLSRYAEIALVFFLMAFGLVCWRVFSPSMTEHWRQASRLPFDDDSASPQLPPQRGE
jgi:cbb3-type cytochrome oxidase subunit 3